jgi:hypothetical protein
VPSDGNKVLKLSKKNGAAEFSAGVSENGGEAH